MNRCLGAQREDHTGIMRAERELMFSGTATASMSVLSVAVSSASHRLFSDVADQPIACFCAERQGRALATIRLKLMVKLNHVAISESEIGICHLAMGDGRWGQNSAYKCSCDESDEMPARGEWRLSFSRRFRNQRPS